MSRIKSKTTDYEYKPFEETKETTQKRAELQNLTKPQQQGFTMQDQLDNTWNQIMNRKEFDYDLNGDALYQQYKDNYIQQGQMAMKDTIGNASQLTGGYGNSYAATAGNLAYQASLQQLNDVVPELYQLAYNKYKDEGDELKNKYAMLTDKEATEYGRYQDALADYYNQYGLLSSEEDKLYNRDYNNWMNQENAKQNIAQSDRDYQYKVNRDSVADKQWQQQFDATEDSREFQEWLSKQNLQLNQDQFKHNKNMDFNNMELANKQYQLELGKLGMEREEHEAAMEQYYEYAKKNGGFTAENVKALSSEDIPEIIQMYVADKNAKGLEIFLYDLYQTGRISKEGYEIYSAMYNLEEEPTYNNNSDIRNNMTNNFFNFLRGK